MPRTLATSDITTSDSLQELSAVKSFHGQTLEMTRDFDRRDGDESIYGNVRSRYKTLRNRLAA